MDTLHVANRELNKFETAIKYFQYPAIYADLGGDILTYNQEFADMLNRPRIQDSSQRIRFSDLVAVEDRASVISHYQKILLGAGKAVKDQYPLLSMNREKVKVDSAGTL